MNKQKRMKTLEFFRDKLGRRLSPLESKGLQADACRRSGLTDFGDPPREPAPISRPVFITGMPRSGSTFLHELLAADPENRAPRVWEAMFPIRARGTQKGRSDPRVMKAAARLWWFRRLAPGADSVHPLRASTPQECVAIQSYTLLSEEFVV